MWRAEDSRLGRIVAVKQLRDSLAGDPAFVERFRREARAVAALSHPNIAGVFDYGEDEGKHFIVMEHVPGRDLSQVIREDGPLDSDRATSITAQVCDALGHAHAAGVIHRDVKPANIIVTDDGRVKVTDFGIARAVGDTTLTAAGSVLGTAHYVSPEQAGGERVSGASDIYSLGIVLYEMLTGSVPFTGDSPIAVAMRHLSDDVPPPSELQSEVPAHLDDAVARATAKEPTDRFPTAEEMAAALRRTDGGATAPMAGP
ncbi:MAG: protein kinase domain-containing protein, partial [Stackebrandtia sp.]